MKINKSNMDTKTLVFLLFVLFCGINSLGHYSQEIVHTDSEFAKVCAYPDKKVLVVSSVRGMQMSKESLLDEYGNVIYGNASLPLGYTGSAQVTKPYPMNGVEQDNLLFFHNKQNIVLNSPNELVHQFNQGTVKIGRTVTNNILYKQKSLVALKNGKVLLAGINPLSAEYAETTAFINIMNPMKNNTFGSGLSFTAYSEHISCYEQKDNEVYCVYVSYEDKFVSKLIIKKILVNNMTLVDKGSKIIKHFYTQFNFVKASKFNDTYGMLLFQTGNGKSYLNYGNKGGDLYFYHYQITNDNNLVNVIRQELLSEDCNYNEDVEDYNADFIALSSGKIFATCEQNYGLRGFIILPGEPEIKKFNFYDFKADTLKNPSFVKFGKLLGLFYTYRF